MEPGLLRDVLALALGVVTGILSAAFGVGGAVVSTPGIRALGASAFLAVGTTLPSVFPSAISGTLRYVREGLVDWRVVAWTAPAGLAASVGGSFLSHVVPGNGHWLMILTAVLIGTTAVRMARRPARATPSDVAEAEAQGVVGSAAGERLVADAGSPIATQVRGSPAMLVGIGIVAGGLSGLLGVGGGVIMVPAFAELVRLPLKTTIATSLVCVGLFAIPGTITHSLLGDIDWRFALELAVGVVPGARIGAALAIRSTDLRLRGAVATFLGLVAVVYAASELSALIR